MFWKIYFVFIILISIPLYVRGAAGASWEFIIDLSLLVIQLFSIYGLAWGTRVFNKVFWQIYFPICAAWNLGHAYFTFEGDITIVFTLMYLPLLFGTYLYAFRRNDFWSQKSEYSVRSQ